jgi:hypothetical protein
MNTFGPPPHPARPFRVNNGTASLLKTHGQFFAVTCEHVLRHYRKVRGAEPNCVMVIGDCHFDPLPQIVIEDQVIDVCVIRLTPTQAAEVTRGETGIGRDFFTLEAQLSTPVKIGDFVTFAGFPGELRRPESFDSLNFGTYSSGAARVTDRHADYLVCQFEREFWVRSGDNGDPEPEHLGGLSGGPAFVLRHSPAGIMSYEFCGIVFRMHEGTESLYVRDLSALNFSGDMAAEFRSET